MIVEVLTSGRGLDGVVKVEEWLGVQNGSRDGAVVGGPRTTHDHHPSNTPLKLSTRH